MCVSASLEVKEHQNMTSPQAADPECPTGELDPEQALDDRNPTAARERSSRNRSAVHRHKGVPNGNE